MATNMHTAPDMTVEITVPVRIDGALAFEFEAAVDIRVTYWGCAAQTYGPPDRCYPAEGPEWETTGFWIDCGFYSVHAKRHVTDLRPAPDWLAKVIEEYLATREGGDQIAEHIMENAA